MSHPRNEDFGVVQDWPPERANLLLDYIEPDLRQAWIIRIHNAYMAAPADLRTLAYLQARCVTLLLQGKSALLHKQEF